MAVVVHHYGFDTTAKHFPMTWATRIGKITVPEPKSSRRNGRCRLFLQSIDLWSACESHPFPSNEPLNWCFQSQREPQELPNPFII